MLSKIKAFVYDLNILTVCGVLVGLFVFAALGVAMVKSALANEATRPHSVAVERQVTPTVRHSQKSLDMDRMADAVSERECTRLDETLRNPYHEKNPYERNAALNCMMLRERVANPIAWEGAKAEFDKEALQK